MVLGTIARIIARTSNAAIATLLGDFWVQKQVQLQGFIVHLFDFEHFQIIFKKKKASFVPSF